MAESDAGRPNHQLGWVGALGEPEPTMVVDSIPGMVFSETPMSMRTTEPWLTMEPFAATVPFRIFVTMSAAQLPPSRAAMPHGPLMSEP